MRYYFMTTVHKRTEIENSYLLLCKMCFLTQKTSCPPDRLENPLPRNSADVKN